MLNFDSPIAAFEHWEKNTPTKPFLRQHINNKVHSYSFEESGDEIRRIASA